MSSGIRWNSKLFASYYMDHDSFKELREYRAELLRGIVQNTFAATAEGYEGIITTLDHFQRQWHRFTEIVEESIDKRMNELGVDWNKSQIRGYNDKEVRNFIKIHCDTDEKKLLFFQIFTIKREDYDKIIEKTDEFAYKYWKGDISSREFLAGQHQMKEELRN